MKFLSPKPLCAWANSFLDESGDSIEVDLDYNICLMVLQDDIFNTDNSLDLNDEKKIFHLKNYQMLLETP